MQVCTTLILYFIDYYCGVIKIELVDYVCSIMSGLGIKKKSITRAQGRHLAALKFCFKTCVAM